MSSNVVTNRANPLLWIALVVLVVLVFIALEVFGSPEEGVAPEEESVKATTISTKLFNPTPIRYSGAITTPDDAKVFASIKLVLNCPQSPKGTLSSATGGKGDWFVDNFLKLNDKNVCKGQIDQETPSCFKSWLGGTNYVPVPPLDISSSLAQGLHEVKVELLDYGLLLGSSEIWLTTNCSVYTPASTEPVDGVIIDDTGDGQ